MNKEQIREQLRKYSFSCSLDPGYERLAMDLAAHIPALLAANDELEKRVKGLEWNLENAKSYTLSQVRITTLEKENAELRKDKERLDWLDSHSQLGTFAYRKVTRTAIDSATKEDK